MSTAELIYDPSVFDVQTFNEAVKIILTPEGKMTSDERWTNEAPALMRLIEEYLEPKFSQVILDYGCGVGRLAKPLIGYHHCTVIGVDTSPSMRALATSLVSNDNFVAIAPPMMNLFGQADHALAVWTLQHCLQPEKDIKRIALTLKENGKLFVVNNHLRAVPVQGCKWANDHIDVRTLLDVYFIEEEVGKLDESITRGFSEDAFWAVYRKR